ncbi:MAG: hypothetical protein QM692_04210 [Thermomicrobiales bacterium]
MHIEPAGPCGTGEAGVIEPQKDLVIEPGLELIKRGQVMTRRIARNGPSQLCAAGFQQDDLVGFDGRAGDAATTREDESRERALGCEEESGNDGPVFVPGSEQIAIFRTDLRQGSEHVDAHLLAAGSFDREFGIGSLQRKLTVRTTEQHEIRVLQRALRRRVRDMRQGIEADDLFDQVRAAAWDRDLDADERIDMVGNDVTPASADQSAGTAHIGQSHQSAIEESPNQRSAGKRAGTKIAIGFGFGCKAQCVTSLDSRVEIHAAESIATAGNLSVE